MIQKKKLKKLQKKKQKNNLFPNFANMPKKGVKKAETSTKVEKEAKQAEISDFYKELMERR